MRLDAGLRQNRRHADLAVDKAIDASGVSGRDCSRVQIVNVGV